MGYARRMQHVRIGGPTSRTGTGVLDTHKRVSGHNDDGDFRPVPVAVLAELRKLLESHVDGQTPLSTADMRRACLDLIAPWL